MTAIRRAWGLPRVSPIRRIAAWRPTLRHLWLVPGLALAVVANLQAGAAVAGLAVVIAAGLLPHLPTLLRARGRRLFNVLHEPVLPLALLAVALTGILPGLATAAALGWLGHLAMDWGFGDGLRHADGRTSRSAVIGLLSARVVRHG